MNISSQLDAIIVKLRKESTRWDAILELKLLKDPAFIPPLIALLKDSDWVVRWSVAEKLGDMKDLRAMEPLLDCLGDSDFHVIKNVQKGLIKFGPIVITSAINRLKLRNSILRNNAMALIESFGSESMSYLKAELTSNDPIILNRVVHLIWKIGKVESEDLLIENLNNKEIQKNIIVMLGSLKSIVAIPYLIKLYENKSHRRLILYAMKLIGAKSAFPVIIRSLKSVTIKPLSEAIIMRIGPAMLPYLLAALSKKNQARIACVRLIEKIGPERILHEIKVLASTNPEVAMLTKELLQKNGGMLKEKKKGLFSSFFG
jgi:HEAT repeat protein